MINLIKRNMFFFGAAGLLTLSTGCEMHKPQPGTWWGVRQVREVTAKPFKESDKKNEPIKRSIASPSAQKPVAPQDDDFDTAVRLIRKEHKFAEAQRLLTKVVERNPNNSEAFRWLGDCYYNQMELQNAIDAYSESRRLDPNNYFALRGKGFSHLHLGHELWRAKNRSMAHENYKRALELLQKCLRTFPADSEAMYGRAMAAEGASRKLYANAVGLLRSSKKPEAEVMARNCLSVIDEGIEASKYRINVHLEEIGPRALMGGLFLRRAMLMKEFDRMSQAIADLQKALKTQETILSDIDEKNPQAAREAQNCQKLIGEWKAQAGS